MDGTLNFTSGFPRTAALLERTVPAIDCAGAIDDHAVLRDARSRLLEVAPIASELFAVGAVITVGRLIPGKVFA